MRELSNFTKERKGFEHGWLCSCHVGRPVGKILSSNSDCWVRVTYKALYSEINQLSFLPGH